MTMRTVGGLVEAGDEQAVSLPDAARRLCTQRF